MLHSGLKLQGRSIKTKSFIVIWFLKFLVNYQSLFLWLSPVIIVVLLDEYYLKQTTQNSLSKQTNWLWLLGGGVYIAQSSSYTAIIAWVEYSMSGLWISFFVHLCLWPLSSPFISQCQHFGISRQHQPKKAMLPFFKRMMIYFCCRIWLTHR